MRQSIWRRLFGWLQRSPQAPVRLEPHRMKRMKRDEGKRKQLLPWADALDQIPREWQIAELDGCCLVVAPHALFLVHSVPSPGAALVAGLDKEKWQSGRRSFDNPFLRLNDLMPDIRASLPAQADLPVLQVVVLPPAVALPSDPNLRQLEQDRIILHDQDLLTYLLRKHARLQSQV